jgi:Domain of unknown function (DUF4386)
MKSIRSAAVVVGILYIVGTVSGVLGAVAVSGLLGGPDTLGQVAAHANQVRWGALCILAMGVSLALVPAVLYPILSRLSRPLAIGYLIFRGALETFTYLAVASCWLILVATAEQARGAGEGVRAQLGSVAEILVKAQDPIITAVQDLTFGIGAMMLYYLLYQGRLLPRWLSVWGLLGAVAYFAGGLVAVFGANPMYLLLLLGVQEMVMAVWLIVKGFNTDAPVFHSTRSDPRALLV